MMIRIFIAFALTFSTIGFSSAETVVDFEELSFFNGSPPSGNGQYFNGYGAGATAAGFTSKGVSFTTNEFGPGWSYSNADDANSPGFMNQFAAYPRGGSAGAGAALIGSNYAMVNTGSSTLLDGTPVNGASLTFETMSSLTSIDVANGTYGIFWMRDGIDTDFVGNPQFNADAVFTDGDFFRLFITGFDGENGSGNVTGTLAYDLANYGGPGIADDKLLTTWDTIQLSGFAPTRSLTFATTSSQISDFGGFGIFHDVPAYVAVDNLSFVTAIPEPASGTILSLAGLAFLCRRRRRHERVSRGV
ncbi:MAG: DUF4465 domain-containing protein [Planctomycetales bacterium]|nr:DUF4465 domain-containing protein [Planctomycetales bacterium]